MNKKRQFKKNRLIFFNQTLAFIFILLLPTQFGKHFFFDFSYINGIRTDYLAPTFYLIDIITLLLITLNIKTAFKFFKNKKLLLFLSILIVNSFLALSQQLSFYKLIRIMELLSIAAIFSSKILSKQKIITAFTVTAVLEFLLAVAQFINKGSIQGVFYFFGERYFSSSTPGVAKISIGGIEAIRAYGTFSHPNSLAGFYLLLYFFVLTINSPKVSFYLKNLGLLIFSLLIFISFSKTAIIVYLVLNFIYLFKTNKKSFCRICFLAKLLVIFITSFVFFIPQGDSFNLYKRVILNGNAFKIMSQKPFFGVGLNSYLLAQKQFPTKFYDFLNQPVHNIFLLFFSEIGLVVGSFLILIFFNKIKKFILEKPYIFMVILLTGLLDHYWLTLIQNFLLLGIIVW